MLLLNKIQVNSNSASKDVLNLCAFADDIHVYYNSTDFSTNATFSVRYIPDGLSSGVTKVLLRQDAKTVNLTPLSTAVYGQGLAINETVFGSSTESYFLNSISFTASIAGGDFTFRYGVSNFTQTQDNNPFSALSDSNVLYFEV